MARDVHKTSPEQDPFATIADSMLQTGEHHPLTTGALQAVVLLMRPWADNDPRATDDTLDARLAYMGFENNAQVLAALLEHADAIAKLMGAPIQIIYPDLN